jgi:hypothetical protein
MPGYDSFMCPNCEGHFRVIWPNPLPHPLHKHCKVKIKCPECEEITELYDLLLARIKPDPQPGLPSVEVISVSPRDPNPDPDAVLKFWQAIYIRRAARFKATYGN